ncbi:MAG: FecR domain-containing protein [Rhodospirillales bacterium]|nr:FecR domain-containing protein [Rhodospirillales bacterium]
MLLDRLAPTRLTRRAVVAGLTILSGTAVLAAAAPVGQVLATKGAVFLETGRGREPAAKGTPLSAGDVVVTGEGSKAKLLLNDGTIISVGESARLVIAQYQSSANGYLTRVGAERGALGFLFRRALDSSRFEVETETAVAAVRGTRWLVEAMPGHTAVALLSGVVAVRARGGAGGEVALDEPGEGTDVRAGAAPTPPSRWGAARFAATLARASFED